MSSLSLPRVLHQRKTSLELERENFEKLQALSINKAINNIESPVKEKHVRIIIIGTFRDQNPELFWQCVLKLPLQENRITAWKFCHVLHKILRDGHPQTILYTQKHKKRISDLGKLWCHLKEGYGKLIQLYCQLLLVKLDFHLKNPGFPGNLVVSSEELEKIGENDINNYFQMSVEMFDYMDELLALQEAIFGSLDMSRSNSMTSSGQCRLAPLIQCIQDSSQLYDYCVKILFKLHAQLSADILSGHRTRFLKQFQQLKQFYFASSNLQYFKNLIQIPLLPENPPNILVQADLHTYVTPVVILPQQEEPDSSQITVDSINVSNDSSHNNCSRSMSPDLITQRDNLIDHLQNELIRCHSLIIQLKKNIVFLEQEILEKEEKLNSIKNAYKRSQDTIKMNDVEIEKLKVLEEKFNKLKEVYGKLREEHIQLIRQKADVDKQLANLKNINSDTAEGTNLEDQLAYLQTTIDAATEQNQELMCKIEWTTKEKALLESKLQESLNMKNEVDEKLQKLETFSSNLRDSFYGSCKYLLSYTMDLMKKQSFNSIACSTDEMENVKEQIFALLKAENIDIVQITYLIAVLMLLGKATSNCMQDIENEEKILELIDKIGRKLIEILDNMQTIGDKRITNEFTNLCDDISELCGFNKLAVNSNSLEILSDLVEDELATMDKAIELATQKIEEMLNQSKKADSGLKLEVNGKILDSCTGLMKNIRLLVQKSKILQAEIVAAGKTNNNNISTKEFYKRNHQWTEGLISAAKAVGMGAKYLLTAADDVVSGNGKLERLIVASQGVAASTAQLVVASRVKADCNSQNLRALSVASKEVTNATANVVATVKSCAQLVEESDDLDFSGLSLHQAKRLEMDSQVRVLELEAALEKERLKLAALRRYHYQFSGDLEQS